MSTESIKARFFERRVYVRIVNNANPNAQTRLDTYVKDKYGIRPIDPPNPDTEIAWPVTMHGLGSASLVLAGSSKKSDQIGYAMFMANWDQLDTEEQKLVSTWFTAIQQTAQYYDLVWSD